MGTSYYKPLPLQAGPEFFKLFVEHGELKNVKINVPRTIGLFNDKFYMRTTGTSTPYIDPSSTLFPVERIYAISFTLT